MNLIVNQGKINHHEQKLLDKILLSANLNKDDFQIIELEDEKEIDIPPECLIISMGAVPAKVLLGKKSGNLTELVNSPLYSFVGEKNYRVIQSYSLHFLLQNSRKFILDLVRKLKQYDNKYTDNL